MRRMESRWSVHGTDNQNKIVYIEDQADSYPATKTITNNAENVLDHFRTTFGNAWRVVYKDTDGEWWEIVRVAGYIPAEWRVVFKRWHGLAWDVLQS